MISPSLIPLPDNTNTHKKLTSMPTAGFELANPARERPQTLALDCAATGIGKYRKTLTVITSHVADEMSRSHLRLWYRAVTRTIPKLYTNYVLHTTCSLKADSHIACRSHAAHMPFPCHVVPLRV